MEERDRLELVDRLEPGQDHDRLDHDRPDEEQVVSRHAEETASWQRKDGREEEAGEQACPSLLDPEVQELGREPGCARKVGSCLKTDQVVIEGAEAQR